MNKEVPSSNSSRSSNWPMSRFLQVGELIAAVAVVISVIVVGLEIRQNSEAQIQQVTQTAVSDYIGSLERLVDNKDFTCLYVKAVQDYRALSGSERLRFSAYYMSTYYQLQEMHRLSEEGAIDADTWSGFHGLLTETTRYPGVRQWFSDRRHWFSERFQRYIDGLIETHPPIDAYLFEDQQDTGCS
jgi:hypothetical protein